MEKFYILSHSSVVDDIFMLRTYCHDLRGIFFLQSYQFYKYHHRRWYLYAVISKTSSENNNDDTSKK